MNTKYMLTAVVLLGVLLSCAYNSRAENIDPDNDDSQYAYGENIGWVNFEPGQGPGITVTESQLRGFAWAENIGWINLSPATYGGVSNDGVGNLSGYAWAENVGWVNFDPTVSGDPTDYGVTIDEEGNFDGWAWGENIGWVHFQSVSPFVYKVKACVVTLEDLANFAAAWLEGGNPPANLDGGGTVDMSDFSIFASHWADFCPDNWTLK